MMTQKNISFALLALLASSVTCAQAGEFHRHHGNGWQEGAAGVNGLPVHIRGIGTFAGGITATRIHGNGVYIAIAPGINRAPALEQAPRAKIMNVTESEDNNSVCVMEHDVCVIRPK
ncbi:hypothetical protein [Rhizobium sp. C1]|uniref:hypothetical protein n=1 Tax=Rhizobium sp. C1 TaxID=1349799 RepID=UPI001E394150|nr:hypothetical protein [Rhizobium sp. C1]MCD2179296.1 hypothetical protein [Rhizobium sp. C1]